MNLVSRIKKIQEELTTMKEQCRELLAAKQVCNFSNCFGFLLEGLIRVLVFFFFFGVVRI